MKKSNVLIALFLIIFAAVAMTSCMDEFEGLGGKPTPEVVEYTVHDTLKTVIMSTDTMVVVAYRDSIIWRTDTIKAPGDTITVTETVTVEVIKYDTIWQNRPEVLVGYRIVGSPVHDKWNATYPAENGFGIDCENHVVVREVLSNLTEGEEIHLPYRSDNFWAYEGTVFEVNNLAAVLNVREDIKGGAVASIEGNLIIFTHSATANKVSKGTFEYQPQPCVAVLRYITITSATTAVVDIYHDDEKIGEATIPVTITEKAVPLTYEFVHVAYRPVAEVIGNDILVICDNLMDPSRGASVNYTVVNKFSMNMPTISREAIGHSYDFNNGTAVVEGSNVVVTYISSEVSDIMFDGKNYKQEAPVCRANVKSIRFGETTADITFSHDDETVTATVPVEYEVIVPTTQLEGRIICGSVTDHYADHVSNLTGTDQHILTQLANGAYLHYYRPVGSNNFSVEELSSVGNLAAGRALAWWYEADKMTRHLGSVEAYERDGESGRYLLIYKDANDGVQYYLGKAEETIASPFRYPIHGILQEVVKNGKTFYTFDGTELFEGTL